MDVLRVRNCLNDLIAELHREVTVLQHDPLTLLHALGHHPPGRLLLPLTHGELLVLLTEVLGQQVDLIGWVRTSGEEAEQWSPVVRLTDHPLQVEDDVLQEAGAQRVVDILPGLGKGPVWTPGPDEEQLSEDVQGFLVPTRYLLLKLEVDLKSQSVGKFTSSGASVSHHVFQSFSESITFSSKTLNSSILLISTRFSQITSNIHL